MVKEKELQRLIRAKQTLENDREIFMSRWREIARQMVASYGSWSKSSSTNTKQLDGTKDCYDNTANESSNQMADGLMGSCFGRNIAWFNLLYETEELNDNNECASWLYNQEKKLYRQFDRSNFYDEARSFIRQGADFGTACMFMEEMPTEGKPFFRTLHPKDVVLMEDRFGKVDTMFRDLFLTRDDAIAYFGEDKLPDVIKHSEDYTKKYVFHHYVGANYRFELSVDGTDEYISLYWSDEDPRKTVKEERYPRKPFVAWRWNRDLEGSVYGTQAPGMMQISNMRSANVLSKNIMQKSQMIATPPIKKTEGLVINIKPAGITDLKAGEDFTPVNVTGDLNFTEVERQYVRQCIRQAYYADFFLLLSRNLDKTKTATEVAGIMNEQSNIMSSFFNRLATEFLEPVIEFVFQNEVDNGRLDAVPPDIADAPIKIDFVSPLFLIQKRSHTVDNLMQATTQAVALAQVHPEVLDKIKFDDVIDAIADGWNVRKLLIKEDNEVKQIREARAQMQQATLQQQQQMAETEMLGKAYQQTTKAPEEGSGATAINNMLGVGNGK